MPKNSRNAPKRQTRIFYRNLQCFEPSQGRCEQSLYRAQGHFCWYLRCFLRFLAAHNGPFLGQNGPANLKFGTAPPPQTPPPKRSMPTTPSATALSVINVPSSYTFLCFLPFQGRETQQKLKHLKMNLPDVVEQYIS